jgi:hypothetical protein
MPADSTQRDVTPGNQTPRPYCSAAGWFALDRVQVPTEYVPPADVQIAWPNEQAATQSKMAITTGTGLILRIRGLSCWPFGCDMRTPRFALIRLAPCSWGPARSTMPGIYAVPGRVRRAIVRLRDTTPLRADRVDPG